MPEFEDLPFNARPDLTPYLVHLTRHSKPDDGFSAFDNLTSILKMGRIMRSAPSVGFIKGRLGATCFMDVPFASMKYVLTPEDTDPQKPRYQPYGIAITKKLAYQRGCRPVLYLSDTELRELGIPADQLWRVVRLEVKKGGDWISWLHEREWRCRGDFELPSSIQAVFVRTTKEAERLTSLIREDPKSFKCKPRSVIPFTVICQGLLR